MVDLDKGLGLTDDQRQRFVELLATEVRPPRRFGQGDYWYLMLQASRVPESKIKAIFDAPQWRLLSRQFGQARGMEPMLRSNGVIPDDEPAGEKAATAGWGTGCAPLANRGDRQRGPARSAGRNNHDQRLTAVVFCAE